MSNGQPMFLGMAASYLIAIARARDAANSEASTVRVFELFNATTGATRYGSETQVHSAKDETPNNVWFYKLVAVLHPEITHRQKRELDAQDNRFTEEQYMEGLPHGLGI